MKRFISMILLSFESDRVYRNADIKTCFNKLEYHIDVVYNELCSYEKSKTFNNTTNWYVNKYIDSKNSKTYINNSIDNVKKVGLGFYVILKELSNIDNLDNHIYDILMNKNSDYDNSFERVIEKTSCSNMVTRLYDKKYRAYNLLCNNKKNKVQEKVEDTLINGIGYSVLCMNYLNKLL